jgi:hypothetical protein
MGVKKSVILRDFQMGQFIFAASSYEKLWPKTVKKYKFLKIWGFGHNS